MKFFSACGSILSSKRLTIFQQYLLPALLVLLLAACTSHPLGPPGKGVLKSRQFADLLVDMHYMESVFELNSNFNYYNPDMDSLDFYTPIFEKHGVTREVFIKSMEYYAYNPPQFEALYTKVLDELAKRASEAELSRQNMEVSELSRDNMDVPEPLSEAPVSDGDDIWDMERIWTFPGAGPNKLIDFSIPVTGPGIYTFSASIKLDPADYSEDPVVNIWFWYDDGTESGYTEPFGNFTITKDGFSRPVTVSKQLTNPRVTHIRGRILDLSNAEEGRERSGEVRDIEIIREDIPPT
jgi:hypothetical protein